MPDGGVIVILGHPVLVVFSSTTRLGPKVEGRKRWVFLDCVVEWAAIQDYLDREPRVATTIPSGSLTNFETNERSE